MLVSESATAVGERGGSAGAALHVYGGDARVEVEGRGVWAAVLASGAAATSRG